MNEISRTSGLEEFVQGEFKAHTKLDCIPWQYCDDAIVWSDVEAEDVCTTSLIVVLTACNSNDGKHRCFQDDTSSSFCKSIRSNKHIILLD